MRSFQITFKSVAALRISNVQTALQAIPVQHYCTVVEVALRSYLWALVMASESTSSTRAPSSLEENKKERKEKEKKLT